MTRVHSNDLKLGEVRSFTSLAAHWYIKARLACHASRQRREGAYTAESDAPHEGVLTDETGHVTPRGGTCR